MSSIFNFVVAIFIMEKKKVWIHWLLNSVKSVNQYPKKKGFITGKHMNVIASDVTDDEIHNIFDFLEDQ